MYRHTQPGTLMRVVLGLGLLIVLVFLLWGFRVGQIPGTKSEETAVAIVTIAVAALLMMAALLLFHNLTVMVDETSVRFKFGIGLVGRKISFDQIESCQTVTNSWLWGWSVRRIPGGWLYNVSDLRAIELKLKKKGIVRIGTDEPEVLAAVVRERLAAFH